MVLISQIEMKTLIRNIAINALALFILSQAFEGVKISGGLTTLLFGGFVFSIMLLILKPILSIITLPINFLTFGSFTWVINLVLIYLLTIFVPQISINAFIFQGVGFAGFVIPKLAFNSFFAYIVCSVVFSAIISLIKWLFE